MRVLFLAIALFPVSYSFSQGAYEVIFEANKDGEVLSGSKAQLIDYVRSGNPIRVGWELRFKYSDTTIVVEHWADAGFITIHMGEVFAQIGSIYEQSIGHHNSSYQVYLTSESEANDWVAILGTNGVMKQKYEVKKDLVDHLKSTGLTDEEVRKQNKDMETMKVKSRWAVLR